MEVTDDPMVKYKIINYYVNYFMLIFIFRHLASGIILSCLKNLNPFSVYVNSHHKNNPCIKNIRHHDRSSDEAPSNKALN